MEEKLQDNTSSSTRRIAKDTVISSLIWKFLERGGVQGVQFVLSIVLARLVSPGDYGAVALVLVFIQVATVFVQSGLNTALIQKRDSDDADFSSIFYLSLFIAALCYGILFLAAPLIAGFYSQEVLAPAVRVVSLTLFFGAVNSVQSAYVSKTMQFRRFFCSSMGAVVGSGAIGAVLAYRGLGVWALVVQQLARDALVCLILWLTVRWRPRLMFSVGRVRALFGFGWKLLCSGLLDTVFRNIHSLIVGRVYDSQILGYFNRGQQFPQVLASNLDGSIQSVMLPTLSASNDDVREVKRLTRRSISTSAFILMPCMFGLAAVAEPLVKVLLTDKWLFCVPFLQLACISYSLYPIHTANLTGINALGRSDVFLKLEIIKKCITVINISVTLPFGIHAMAIGEVVCSFISTAINAWPNKKLMGYSCLEQWRDLMPSFVLSIVMAAVVRLMNLASIAPLALLASQILVGVAVYALLSRLLKLEAYAYFVGTIKGFAKRWMKKTS